MKWQPFLCRFSAEWVRPHCWSLSVPGQSLTTRKWGVCISGPMPLQLHCVCMCVYVSCMSLAGSFRKENQRAPPHTLNHLEGAVPGNTVQSTDLLRLQWQRKIVPFLKRECLLLWTLIQSSFSLLKLISLYLFFSTLSISKYTLHWKRVKDVC